MSFRSLAVWPVKWALERAGFGVIDRNRFGYNAFFDIKRLSQAWQYPIAVFFDVGANDGATIGHARRSFVNCRITAFEPHPTTFSELKKHMANAENVELVNVALGPEVGDRTMFEYDESVLNSLVPNAQFAVRFGVEARQIRVRCTTIDRFCSERGIRRIDVLKIDTEGFDIDVLKGASSMLANQAIKFVYFEFNDINPHPNASGGALSSIDQLIAPYGYRFIATYNDYIVPHGKLFLVSNALYALPPAAN